MKWRTGWWFLAVLVGVIGVAPAAAQRADWKNYLEGRIAEKYPQAKLSWDGRNIKQPGEPLLLMQGNIPAETRPLWSYFKDGRLQPRGAGGFLSDVLREADDERATRDRVTLPLYQPVFLAKIAVANDRLVLFVVTGRQFVQESVDRAAIARFVEGASLKGDTFTRTEVAARQAGLALVFPRGVLERMPFDAVVAEIDKVLLRVDDPRAPKFGSVGLGMTRDEVVRNLGKPVNVVSLGAKEILVYARIKVTLEGGKVTNVE